MREGKKKREREREREREKEEEQKVKRRLKENFGKIRLAKEKGQRNIEKKRLKL